MDNFSYHAPGTLSEALRIKHQAGAQARFLAGGTDLFLAMQAAAVPTVLDLKRIPELKGIQPLPEGGWRLGALVSMAELESHPALRQSHPALTTAAGLVGAPALRHRATLGGNLCNASPAADTATPLLALDAQVVLVSPRGERNLFLKEFWRGPRSIILDRDELLKEVRLPAPGPGFGCAFERLTRSAMDIALVNAAAALTVDKAGRLRTLRCTMGAVGATVLEVQGLAAELNGSPCTAESLERVKVLARASAAPIDDRRASARYRRSTIAVLAARAVERAYAAAAESPHLK